MAAAWDRALGTTPLLAALLDADEAEGDEMRRRVIVGQLAAVAGLGAMNGPGEVANAVRAELIAAAEGIADEDWSAVVAQRSRQILNTPAPDLEMRILADLALASQGLRNRNHDAIRAASHLALLQGQCHADRGNAQSAQDWYKTSAALADRCGDSHLAIYVRGRQAVRLVYESGSIPVVTDVSASGLALSSSPSLGAVECHVAMANAYARVESRKALESMTAAVEMAISLPDGAGLLANEAGFDPLRRALHHRAYVLSRVGSVAETQAACDDAEAAGMSTVWHTQLRLYLAYRLVSDGDVVEGINQAAEAVDAVPRIHRTRIFGQLVGELLSLLPEARRRADDTKALGALVNGRRG
jgi:hypothetical protein